MIDQFDNDHLGKNPMSKTHIRLISDHRELSESVKNTEQERKRATLEGITSGAWDASHSDVLRVVLNHVSEAILTMDLEGNIDLVNPVAAHLLGVSASEIIGRQWWNFLARSQREEFRALFRDWRESPDKPPHHGPQEALVSRQDGSYVEVDLSLSGIPGESPKVMVVLHDLTVHKAEYQELRRLARTDSLTGLANRRAFDEVLMRNWRDCNRANMSLSLVMLDVDYFKRFNDEHGHLQGDYCLSKIAEVIESELPSKRCLAARYGGEEFAVILPGCTADMAQAVAERIRTAVNRLRFVEHGLPASARVSVSQGIATHRDSQYRTSSALLSAADTALYHAKVTGRDQVVL